MKNIKDKIKEIIIAKSEVNMNPNEIGDTDYLLFGGLNLDSIITIEILVALEEEYNIVFEDHELTEENMTSVNVIANIIEEKLKKQ